MTERVVIAAALGAMACNAPDARRFDTATKPTCTRAFAERNSVPFVRICPDDLPGVITTAFWIAAAPLACSAGAHESLPCPPILALVRPADRGPHATPAIAARTAQLLDAATAHRTCALRFGGRLPTTAELAQARQALGLVAVLVTIGSDRPPHLNFEELPEWASSLPCLAPSKPETACGISSFPTSEPTHVEWDRIRTCDATPESSSGSLVVGVGESCPLDEPGAAPTIPCLLGTPAPAGPSSRPVFRLRCVAPTADAARHPIASEAGLAATRCVVPESSLIGTIEPP